MFREISSSADPVKNGQCLAKGLHQFVGCRALSFSRFLCDVTTTELNPDILLDSYRKCAFIRKNGAKSLKATAPFC